MSSNRFESHIKTILEQSKAAQVLERLNNKYLQSISINSKGSPLSSLLNKAEIQSCKEFIELMSKYGYPGSLRVKLETTTTRQLLSPYELIQGSSSYKLKARILSPFKWLTTWSGKAYPIGILSSPSTIFPKDYNSCKIYLCTDLKLRCRRSEPLFNHTNSYTSGVGSLPIKEIHKYNFKIGQFVDSSDDPNHRNFEAKSLDELFIIFSETNIIS